MIDKNDDSRRLSPGDYRSFYGDGRDEHFNPL